MLILTFMIDCRVSIGVVELAKPCPHSLASRVRTRCSPQPYKSTGVYILNNYFRRIKGGGGKLTYRDCKRNLKWPFIQRFTTLSFKPLTVHLVQRAVCLIIYQTTLIPLKYGVRSVQFNLYTADALLEYLAVYALYSLTSTQLMHYLYTLRCTLCTV